MTRYESLTPIMHFTGRACTFRLQTILFHFHTFIDTDIGYTILCVGFHCIAPRSSYYLQAYKLQILFEREFYFIGGVSIITAKQQDNLFWFPMITLLSKCRFCKKLLLYE